MIIYNFLGSIIIKVNHLLSLAPLDVFPEKRWRGIAVPIKRSLYPFLSWVRQTLLSLLIVLAPLTSYLESSLLYPLLLLLEAYLILDLTFYPSYSF